MSASLPDAHGSTERAVASESRGLRQAEHARPRPASRSHSSRAVPSLPRLYDAIVHDCKARYKITIRKWQRTMTGAAYELQFADGRIKRLISAPRPRSPVSAAIFLHEVGHHAVGFHRYASRSLEEYYVWQWAFREMAARQIPVDARVRRHYRRSMHHYVRLALSRGEAVPHELHRFLHAHDPASLTG